MSEKSRLIGYVKNLQEAQERERELHKKRPNERMVENTPDTISSYDFWCDDCEMDWSGAASKTVHRLYGDAVVTFRAKHECGNECVRLVSHRDHDPYYQKSEKIRIQ